MIQTTDRIAEPAATVPKLYLISHLKPFQTSDLPSSPWSVFREKYQVIAETMITKSLAAIKRNITQINPKNKKASSQLLVLPSLSMYLC